MHYARLRGAFIYSTIKISLSEGKLVVSETRKMESKLAAHLGYVFHNILPFRPRGTHSSLPSQKKERINKQRKVT